MKQYIMFCILFIIITSCYYNGNVYCISTKIFKRLLDFWFLFKLQKLILISFYNTNNLLKALIVSNYYNSLLCVLATLAIFRIQYIKFTLVMSLFIQSRIIDG